MPAPNTHTFVHLEVSSASVLNDSVKGPIDYLIGRDIGSDDAIEIEDSVEILSGANGGHYLRLPQGSTGQRPTGAAGLLRLNTTLGGLDYHDGSGWEQPLTPDLVTFATLDGNGDVGTNANQLAEGDHSHTANVDFSFLEVFEQLTTFTTSRTYRLNSSQDVPAGTYVVACHLSFQNASAGEVILRLAPPMVTDPTQPTLNSQAFNFGGGGGALTMQLEYDFAGPDVMELFIDRTSGGGALMIDCAIMQLSASYA